MQLDVGANCHDFWDKNLFYVLLFRRTSVHVAGGSIVSAAGTSLITVMFPGYMTLYSLITAYWNPKKRTKTLSLISLKLYSSFYGASNESLSPCTFHESQGHTFFVRTMIKNDLDYINHQVVNKYQ